MGLLALIGKRMGYAYTQHNEQNSEHNDPNFVHDTQLDRMVPVDTEKKHADPPSSRPTH